MAIEKLFFFLTLIPALYSTHYDLKKGLYRLILPVNLLIWFIVLVVLIPELRLGFRVDFYNVNSGLDTIYLFLGLLLLGIVTLRIVRDRNDVKTSNLYEEQFKRIRRFRERANWNETLPYRIALLTGLLGYATTIVLSGGFSTYYGATHLSGLNKSISAYIYNLQYMIIPCVLILAIAAKYKNRRIGIGLILVMALIIFDAWVLGRRGTYMRIGFGLCLYALAILPVLRIRTQKLIKTIVPIVLLLFVVLIYITPVIRHHTALDGNFSFQTLVEDFSARDVLAGSTNDTGNELIYAASLIEASNNYGIDYGEKWLYPFVSLIPRFIWQNKPYYTNFSTNNVDIIYNHKGLVIARGAAPTFIADTYARFKLFGVLVVLMSAFKLEKIVEKNIRHWRDLRSVSTNYLILVSFSYFLLQDFSQGLLHFIYAFLPLTVIIWFVRKFLKDG